MIQQDQSWAYHQRRAESRRHRLQELHCSSIHNRQDKEATKMPINMNRQRRSGRGTQWNICHGKQWNTALCSTVDEPRFNHKTWGNLESKRKIYYDITYRYDLTTDTNEHISTEKDTHRVRRQTMLMFKITVSIRIEIHIKYIYQKDRPYRNGGLWNTLIIYMRRWTVHEEIYVMYNWNRMCTPRKNNILKIKIMTKK